MLTIDWEKKNNTARHRSLVFILISPSVPALSRLSLDWFFRGHFLVDFGTIGIGLSLVLMKINRVVAHTDTLNTTKHDIVQSVIVKGAGSESQGYGVQLLREEEVAMMLGMMVILS